MRVTPLFLMKQAIDRGFTNEEIFMCVPLVGNGGKPVRTLYSFRVVLGMCSKAFALPADK